jgi:hypothetical protein
MSDSSKQVASQFNEDKNWHIAHSENKPEMVICLTFDVTNNNENEGGCSQIGQQLTVKRNQKWPSVGST